MRLGMSIPQGQVANLYKQAIRNVCANNIRDT